MRSWPGCSCNMHERAGTSEWRRRSHRLQRGKQTERCCLTCLSSRRENWRIKSLKRLLCTHSSLEKHRWVLHYQQLRMSERLAKLGPLIPTMSHSKLVKDYIIIILYIVHSAFFSLAVVWSSLVHLVVDLFLTLLSMHWIVHLTANRTRLQLKCGFKRFIYACSGPQIYF